MGGSGMMMPSARAGTGRLNAKRKIIEKTNRSLVDLIVSPLKEKMGKLDLLKRR